MIKRWRLTYEVNMCANNWVEVVVKANTERKAKIIAECLLKKEGHFYVSLIACEEVRNEK